MTVTSQRAAIAVKLLGPLREEAKRRQVANLKHGDETPVVPDSARREESGRAVEHASKIVGVLAKAVHDADPETFKRVERGELSANAAHKIVTGRASR